MIKVGIIGAGLSGSIIAYHLLNLDLWLSNSDYSLLTGTRFKHSKKFVCTIFEQDNINFPQTSPAHIAGGMIAPYCESIVGGNRIYQMGKDSYYAWHLYLDHLLKSTNLQDEYKYSIDNYLWNLGSLIISKQNNVDEVSHYLNKIKYSIGELGYKNTASNKLWYKQFYNKIQLQSCEAELGEFECGVLLTQESHLNSARVMKLLHTVLLNNKTNITIHQSTRVVKVNPLSAQIVVDKPQGITSTSATFDFIIDCRGHSATDTCNIRGVRGEIIQVYAPGVNLIRPIRFLDYTQNIYVIPLKHNNYLIGATEIEANDSSNISVYSALQLLNYACSLHKGFLEARIIQCSSGLRPVAPDGLPIISVNHKVITVNGLSRHGFLLAPYITKQVSNLLLSMV